MSTYTSSRVMPYVYLLVHRVTGQFYFGYREINAVPSNIDLPEYKTSSKVIKAMGFENFDWFIIAEFWDGDDAWDYEQSLIAENFDNPLILNKQHRNGGKKRFKRIDAHKPETIAKMSATRKGRSPSTSHRKALAESKARTWRVTCPDGSEQIVINLNTFCKENGLNSGQMYQVARGNCKHHKGHKVNQICESTGT